jgi:PAS domain S-box-containing protein
MTASPNALSRILLIQNMLGHLPDQQAIFAFVCRGLEELPGVAAARHDPSMEPTDATSPAQMCFALQLDQQHYGHFLLQLTDPDSFAPYSVYVSNLCFMISVIFEERRQKEQNRKQRDKLADSVRERTEQLTAQMQERSAAEGRALGEKVRAEHYLEISEAMILELDPQGRISLINKRGCDILGYPEEELLGRNWINLLIREDRRDSMHEVFAQGVSGRIDLVEYCDNEIITRSGEHRHISWHNTLNHDSHGNLTSILCSGNDISLRKHALDDLANEKERLRVTLRSIGDGVISTDVEGLVALMNPAAEQLTGWSCQEARGKLLPEIFTLVQADSREPIIDPSLVILPEKAWNGFEEQVLLLSRSGREYLLSLNISPIKDHDSQTIGTVMVFKDVTERQKIQENLLRNDRLEALGTLAGGIAHDFNNLLSGIFGHTEIARRHYSGGNEKVTRHLDEALKAFDRAKDLTLQLLTFAKGGKPKREIRSLEPLLTKSIAFALSGSHISHRYSIQDDLWFCDFDENQLAQVIDNLIINAKQAMPEGGEVLISAENLSLTNKARPPLQPRDFVRISITDTGSGIPPEVLQRIFDPFFTTKEHGTGLGLATCYSIVQKHGGLIEVESVLGEGTKFQILLPACPLNTVAKTGPVIQAKDHHGSGTILILDDEDYIRTILQEALESMGYNTLAVADGKDLLAACRLIESKGKLVAAILDLTIPGGTGGKAALDMVRNNYPKLPIFASSGYSEDQIMADPKAFGFTDSISKPYQLADLERLLDRHLVPRLRIVPEPKLRCLQE